MSWGGYIPLAVLYAEINFKNALMSGAFANEVHVSEMRDDYFY